ncbi:MAG: TetR/AcrR family transcriptional regulator [Elusimicrobia bacterium]|nr:TetR/AcrR family transcriptional regulator [Elusimicrobiota bacterium]
MTILERKEREFKRREEDILAAALSLFTRDDWQAVTIDQIAAKAEIGKGTIYKHFASKDEIYARLVTEFFGDMLEKMKAVDATGPVLEVLAAVMRIFWDSFQGRPDYRRLESYCRREDFRHQVGDKMGAELDALDERFMSVLDPLVRRGLADGTLEPRPVEAIHFALHAAMIGLLEVSGNQCAAKGLPPEEAFRIVRDFTLRGISKR